MHLWPVNKLPRMRKVYLFTAFSCSTFQKNLRAHSSENQLGDVIKGTETSPTPFPPTETWCWCQFKVDSIYETAKNQFVFPQPELVKEPHHWVTVCVSIRLCFPLPHHWCTRCVYNCCSCLCDYSLASKHEFWFGTPSVCIFTNYKGLTGLYTAERSSNHM